MKSIARSVTNTLSPSITKMIRMDHTHVLATFHEYEMDTSPQKKKALVDSVCAALEIHSQLEEEIFYPAMRELAADTAVVEKSIPEHNEMRRLIAELRQMEPVDPAYDKTFLELMRDVMHHVADEETSLLPDAERLLADRLGELGMRMTKRRLQLAAPHAGKLVRGTVSTYPTTTVVVAAGALLAGTYLARRTFARHA